MADQKTDLAIVIEAINKATGTLKQVEEDLSSLSEAVDDQSVAAGTAALSMNTLIAGVATGGTIALIAADAFKKLVSTLVDIPVMLFDIAQTASEIEGMGIAMHVVANNAGLTAEAVDEVRDSVVEQNVTTEAANRLMTDLIRNQLDYTQATELATAAQNIAVASGVSSSETIERISTSIASGNTWLLRQLGLVEHLDDVYDKYAETLGKTSEDLDEAGRKQAIVNYVLKEGEKYAGAYEQAMKNAAKVMRSTKDRVEEIAYSFGKVFEPALYEVTKAIYDFVNKIVEWAHENEGKLKAIAKSVGDFMRAVVASVRQFIASVPWDAVLNVINYVIKQVRFFANGLKIVSNVVQIFVRSLWSGIRTLKAFGEAMYYLYTGQFQNLKDVYTEWRDASAKTGEAIMGDLQDLGDAFKDSYRIQEFDLKDWWDSIEAIEGSGWEDRLKQAEEEGEKLSAKERDRLKKMLRDIERANRDYQKVVERRVEDFNESFEDLVLKHRDNIEELTDDLKEENKEYQDNLKELLGDFNEAMDDLEKRHEKKTESIMEDIEDERKKAEEEIEKLTEKYNEQVSLIEKEGEARLGNLKAQLDKERALGDDADKAKVEALEQMIAYEEEGLSSSLEDKKTKHDEEVSDITEKLQDKLDKIQEELDEENALYAESFAERKIQYAEDLAEVKESYEEKRKKLQEELDKETEIRNRYADDFARLADKVAEDDITRLVRKHEEELAEMERDHQDKLHDIKENAFEQGLGFTEGFTEGFDAGYPAIESRINQMKGDFSSLARQYEDYENQITWLPGSAPWEVGGGFGGGGGGAWQHGGLATSPGIVGEAGPEIVLPLNFPKRMAMIMKAMGLGQQSGSQVTQNFYVTVAGSQDVDVLMERAGFALKQGGGH